MRNGRLGGCGCCLQHLLALCVCLGTPARQKLLRPRVAWALGAERISDKNPRSHERPRTIAADLSDRQ